MRLDGDTAVLAYFGANNDMGEVAIYGRTDGPWQLQQTLTGSIPGQGLGVDASLHGDYLAATSNEVATPVQLFRRAANGWLPEASLLPEDATPGVYCWHTAMGASELVIGCGESGSAGAVYVFGKVAGLWTQNQKLMLPDPRDGDAFGFSLDLQAGTLYAGALGRDLDFTNQGAIYTFVGDRLFEDGFD